jgi:hypothetical protein
MDGTTLLALRDCDVPEVEGRPKNVGQALDETDKVLLRSLEASLVLTVGEGQERVSAALLGFLANIGLGTRSSLFPAPEKALSLFGRVRRGVNLERPARVLDDRAYLPRDRWMTNSGLNVPIRQFVDSSNKP